MDFSDTQEEAQFRSEVRAFIDDGALADHEVLLHLEGVDFVIEVEAFRDGVTDGVAAHRDFRGRRRRLEGRQRHLHDLTRRPHGLCLLGSARDRDGEERESEEGPANGHGER